MSKDKVQVAAQIYPVNGVINVDYRYGPYESIAEAVEFLGPDNLDCIKAGLKFGIKETDGTVTDYVFLEDNGGADKVRKVLHIDEATTENAGLMSAHDKAALAAVQAKAQENADDIDALEQDMAEANTGIQQNASAIQTNASDIASANTTISQILAANAELRTTVNNLVGISNDNFMGIFQTVNDLLNDLPTMTSPGWALVGTNLASLLLYTYTNVNDGWTKYSDDTYDFTDYSGLVAQVATIGLKLGDLDNSVKERMLTIKTGGTVMAMGDSFPNSGRYLSSSPTTLSQTGWYHTDLIECIPSTTLVVTMRAASSTVTPSVLYYDADGTYLSYELETDSAMTEYTYTIPSGAHYFRVQTATTTGADYSYYISIEGFDAVDKAIETGDEAVKAFAINGGTLTNTSSSFPNSGRYLVSAPTTISSTGWYHTDMIECSEGDVIVAYVKGSSSSTPALWLYDEDENVVEYIIASNSAPYTYTVPSGVAYYRVQTSETNGYYYTQTSTITGLKDLKRSIDENVSNTAANAASITAQKKLLDSFGMSRAFYPELLNVEGFVSVAGVIRTNSAYRRTDYLDVSHFSQLNLYIKDTYYASVAPYAFYDSNYTLVSVGTATSSDAATYVVDVPSTAKYVMLSCHTNDTSVIYGYASVGRLEDVIYISANGDDGNDGTTENTPVASLYMARALMSTGGTLKIMSGDYESPNFHLDKFARIYCQPNVRFLYGEKITSATLADGYTRVYQVSHTDSIPEADSGDGLLRFLWQHDVPDSNTVISESEYMAQYHAGREYRMPCTRIYEATSISEIESTTDKLMWYHDETNGILYFSLAETDLETYPVVIPDSDIITASSDNDIEVTGLTILYRRIRVSALNSAIFRKCTVGCCVGSAIIYGALEWTEFDSCEVFGASGDGFGGLSRSTHDVVFRNAYVHDVGDDGESGHIVSSTIHYGGLFEYNGNGITPAVGAHSTCYNVIVRNCGVHDWCYDTYGSAFSAQGVVGSSFSSISCFGCLSLNNRKGFRTTNNSGSIFVNCVSSGDIEYGYQGGTQYNCVTLS